MTNATNSALRLLPGPEPFERAVEAFGRRLAAEGRSPNTISAYLRDLRQLSAVLLQRHPDLNPDCVTSVLLDEAVGRRRPAASTRSGSRGSSIDAALRGDRSSVVSTRQSHPRSARS